MMDIKSIFLLESEYVKSLYPFSILHCSWEVRFGPFKYFELIRKLAPSARIIFQARPQHLKSFLARHEHEEQDFRKENILVLNTTILADETFFNEIEQKYNDFLATSPISKSALFVHSDVPLAAFISGEDIINPGEFDTFFLPKLLSDYSRLMPKIEVSRPKVLNFLWETLDIVGEQITASSKFFVNTADFDKLKAQGVNFVNSDKVIIGKNTEIAPGVVLDASEGEIIIGENVKIMANAVIIGPCFIGENSTVKVGAKIYGNTAIGEWCKVGGEIENSIIHAYSNKQHEGFLGHSYISEWVNLGADTNTSDLKNTYGDITVRIENEQFNTGRMFLGLMCGDHTKSAINTSFTTGTIAGICGIIVADGFLPNYIPSFAWRGTKGCNLYKVEKAIETARIVMQRRGKELLQEEIDLIRTEYAKVSQSRKT